MANEKLKRVWVPAPCDPETSAVLESLLSESRAWVSHGRYGGKRPSNPRFPRVWADAAIDSSANGFLAIPRSEKHVASLWVAGSGNPNTLQLFIRHHFSPDKTFSQQQGTLPASTDPGILSTFNLSRRACAALSFGVLNLLFGSSLRFTPPLAYARV
jgi:hypothetical protein